MEAEDENSPEEEDTPGTGSEEHTRWQGAASHNCYTLAMNNTEDDAAHMRTTLGRIWMEGNGKQVLRDGAASRSLSSNEEVVDVKELRFSHDRISRTFSQGNP